MARNSMREKIAITPRRSVALYALLSIAMVIVSYVFVIALAAACVYLPYLIVQSVEPSPGSARHLVSWRHSHRWGHAVVAGATARKIRTAGHTARSGHPSYGMKYVDQGAQFYDAQHRNLQITHLKWKAAKLGFRVVEAPAA